MGVSVGGRYLSGPGSEDGVGYVPGRLGFTDVRLRERYPSSGKVLDTDLSLYGVATAYLMGDALGLVPRHEMTFSLGYGTGMFRSGGNLGFYGQGASDGFFLGSSLRFGLPKDALLTLNAINAMQTGKTLPKGSPSMEVGFIPRILLFLS